METVTVTPKQVIDSLVEAAKVTIEYGYDSFADVKPPTPDIQEVVACLLAPLLVEIILDANNFILTKRTSPEAATTFKQEVDTSIDRWVSNMEIATEFAAKTLQ